MVDEVVVVIETGSVDVVSLTLRKIVVVVDGAILTAGTYTGAGVGAGRYCM